MKICIVIQSDAFRASAGMRIRYDRFRDSLDQSVVIDARTTAELSSGGNFEHDVYIFCKTFDTLALLLARRLKEAGKTVGQDFFDDYFSQLADPRLERFRQWLRDMAPVTDFAICSTACMSQVIQSYMPAVPITTIEDPVAGFDAERVARLAEEKAARARESRAVDVVWFGIGDNPYFPVGLIDLANCDHELADMQRSGWDVRLRIVTNRRPFEGTGAEVLRTLSVGFEVVEWTEDVERQELEQATVALIPVNGQAFSRAKSMNRAVTALEAGCLVLSTGYPLYEQIGEFIYRSPAELLSDLDSGQMRVSEATSSALAARLKELADPAEAARRFVAAARQARSQWRRWRQLRTVCLIHGRTSTIGVHKAAGAVDGLSASTIFTKAQWNFPVRFDRLDGAIVMRVTPAVAEKYKLPFDAERETARVRDFEFVEVSTAALDVPSLRIDLPPQTNPILDLAVYEDVMRFAQECCVAAFPAADILIADTSPFTRKPDPQAVAAERRQRGAAFPDPRAFKKTRTRPILPLDKLRQRFSGARTDGNSQAMQLANSSLFDPDWYLSTYPDVAASGVDPAEHYAKFGWKETRDPGPAFSTSKYLNANPDVAESGVNPLIHYIEHGVEEGRVAPVAKSASNR
jgi:hypothetical protein